jgi:hypothetical protein
MIDKITVMKGYLQIKNNRKNVDYSLLVSKDIEELELMIYEIIDAIQSGEQ